MNECFCYVVRCFEFIRVILVNIVVACQNDFCMTGPVAVGAGTQARLSGG